MENPLVSILIPVVGNSNYLELALTSVLLQTYTNLEIIIRDPTPTDNIKNLLEKEFLPYSDRITYIKDTRYMSLQEVLQELLRHANGTYINFLMEKDLFYPTKIETMMNYFLKDMTNSIKLVTSNIEFVDIHGNLITNLDTVKTIFNSDVHWDSNVGHNMILKYKNYIGGLSAPLFRKKDLVKPFGYFAGYHFLKEIELATWLTLTSQGIFVVITEELMLERKIFGFQNDKVTLESITDWINFIKLARQNICIITKSTESYIVKKILEWINYLLSTKTRVLTEVEMEKIQEYKEYLYI